MMFMRRSRFKHVFGKPNKKEFCYDNIRITKSSWDSTFCTVNPKYIAIITESAGGGSFLVVATDKVGRVERDASVVAGHKASVLDIQWCPHNDDLIASASEDCTVKVWQIPDGGLEPKINLTEPIADLVAHQRRVGLVVWHPTAEHVLLSAGADNMVYIWNVATESVLVEMTFPDMILSASFNYNGSKLVTTCKDRKTRVMNPRTGSTILEGNCHQGNKPQQVVYLRNNLVFTTGFSRMSERQYALWHDDDFNDPLTIQDIDTSNGVLFPFYDGDTSMIYLCGKGDSTIRYFEITDEEPFVHYINMLTSSDPQRGMGCMPKRGLNVNNNEIARFYKLHAKGLCEVIPFTVPRKSELFQDDLYPDTPGDTPALTAEEWMSGRDEDPVLVSLKDCYVAKERPGRKFIKSTPVRSNKAETQPAPPATNTAPSHDHQTPPSGSGDEGGRQPPPAANPAPEQSTTVPPPPPMQQPTQQTQSQHSASIKSSSAQMPLPRQEYPLAPSSLPTNGVTPPNSAPVPGAPVCPTCTINPADVQLLCDDMRKMKIIIKGHERRIKQLEERLRAYEETVLIDQQAIPASQHVESHA